MKIVAVLFTSVLAWAWTAPARADSCSNARPLVPMLVSVQPQEDLAPGKVVILSTDLNRGPDTSGMKCMPVGSLGFELQAPEDDRTPSGELGYLLEMVGDDEDWPWFESQLRGFVEWPALEATDGWVWFNFTDWPERSVDWTFRLAAVDEDGNQGEWSDPVQVTHPGMDYGCATAPQRGASIGCLLLLGVAALWLARGRRKA